MVFNIQEIDLAIIRYKTEIPHKEAKQQRPTGAWAAAGGGGAEGGGKTQRSRTGGPAPPPTWFWPGQSLSKQPVHILSRSVVANRAIRMAKTLN